jgi:two-component system phosphate regulon sensor histidine kinase PhoR
VRLRSDQQLFLSYLVLIAALTIAVSTGASSIFRDHLLETVEADLLRELTLARQIFEDQRGAPIDSIADLLGEMTGRRFTIVTAAGVAVGESAPIVRDRPPADDYRNRPEVRMALEEGAGRAIRYSNTIRADHLYLALPTERREVLRAAVPLSEIDAAISTVLRRILAVGMVAVLVAAFFSFGFTVLVTRPLRRIVEVARALGAGDLTQRVPVYREDDLGDLGTALNTLAGELQRRLGQLEGERAEMQTLIDSMAEGVLAVTATGALRRANPAARRIFGLAPETGSIPPEMISRRSEFLALVARALRGEAVPPTELSGDGRQLLASAHPLPQGGAVLVFLDISQLRRLEDVRRDFVANASHELKTPLTAIRGYSETLLDPDLPPEMTRRFAEIVKSNSDRLQQIIDDLLDLSRIEAGGWRVESEAVDVEEITREVVALDSLSSKWDSIELVIDLAPGHTVVWADRSAVRQIVANLLGNALRYTPTGGRITVRTRPGVPASRGAGDWQGSGIRPGEWTVIEVADTGTGIGRVHLSRIFERFYRADPARSREGGGTGLGLAIAKHLVEAHGGWVEAESEIGRGTVIRFALPAYRPGSTEVAPAP